MRRIIAIGMTGLYGLMLASRAATFEWDGGPNGNFTDPGWLNTMTLEGGGPPGRGDTALLSGGTLTMQGGSVQELEGPGTFDVEGAFECGLLFGATVTGQGQLTAESVNGVVFVNGGHLIADTVTASQLQVQAGGTLLTHGPFTAHAYLLCADPGSSINAQGGMTDVGLNVRDGGHVTATSIQNLNGSSSSLSGSGALVSVSGKVALAEGATLDMASGASLQVGGAMILDGGTNFTGGGASLTDPQTSVAVAQHLAVGYEKGEFSLSIKNGATLSSAASFIGELGAKGSVVMSDNGTLWTIQSGGLGVGAGSPGSLTINNGASLLLEQGAGGFTSLLVGGAGSAGTIQVDGAGSLIDATQAGVSIGSDSGSQGNVQIQNHAGMVVGDYGLFVGDAGPGDLTLSAAGQVDVMGSETVFVIGHHKGATGTVSVSDGSSLTIQGPTTVGDKGTGSISVVSGTVRTDGTTVGGEGENFASGTVNIFASNPRADSYWIETNRFDVASSQDAKGTISVGSGGHLQITGDCLVGDGGNGTLDVSKGGSVVVGGPRNVFRVGNQILSTGVVSVGDTNSILQINSQSLVGSSGTGTLYIYAGGSVYGNEMVVGGVSGLGTVNITGPGANLNVNGSLYVGGKPPEPTFAAGHVMVTSTARLRVGPLLWISSFGDFTLDDTGQIAVGTGGFGPPGTLRVTPGGSLFGQGRVHGQVIEAPGGHLIPGGSPGILTIDGSYEQDPGGELDIAIGGNQPGSGFSQLIITGTASIGGTLNVILANGFTPAPGETFPVILAAGLSGTFSQVNGASISYSPAGVTLNHVTGVIGEAQLTVQNQGQNRVISWPQTVQDYSLQSALNLSGPWSAVPATENTYVVAPQSPSVFFRLIEAPSLFFTRQGPNLRVSWNAAVQDFSLQTTTNLTLGHWTPISAPSNTIVVSPTNPASFFRLTKP
jgi:T5SS/PEP-CTERM-associated repeat protein